MCQIRTDMVRMALTKILRAPFDFRHKMFREGVYPLWFRQESGTCVADVATPDRPGSLLRR